MLQKEDRDVTGPCPSLVQALYRLWLPESGAAPDCSEQSPQILLIY